MPSRNGAAVRDGRTFTETARREQIVRAAIVTLAELGYADTSLGKIARTAGLSSVGMISYYFAGKAELMSEVVATVLSGAEAEVAPRIAGVTGAVAALRMYIEASLEYIADHRDDMVALFEVTTGSHPLSSGGDDVEASAVTIVEDLVAGAQAELGTPDPLEPRVVALAIRGAIHRALAERFRAGGPSETTGDLAKDGIRIADLFERSLRFTQSEGDIR